MDDPAKAPTARGNDFIRVPFLATPKRKCKSNDWNQAHSPHPNEPSSLVRQARNPLFISKFKTIPAFPSIPIAFVDFFCKVPVAAAFHPFKPTSKFRITRTGKSETDDVPSRALPIAIIEAWGLVSSFRFRDSDLRFDTSWDIPPNKESHSQNGKGFLQRF